jgi:hypothetical protein
MGVGLTRARPSSRVFGLGAAPKLMLDWWQGANWAARGLGRASGRVNALPCLLPRALHSCVLISLENIVICISGAANLQLSLQTRRADLPALPLRP